MEKDNPLTIWVNMLNETARFVTGRIQHDMETGLALLDCRTPQDVMRVQNDYARETVSQYAFETARLMGLLTSTSVLPVSRGKGGLARGYDDVPL